MTDPPRYVRFGHLPKDGRSRNARTGERHAGVSVFAGLMDDDEPLFRIDTSALSGAGRSHVVWVASSDRPAYFVWGERVGKGPAGEPLVRPERVLPVPKAAAITTYSHLFKPALERWSRGPRDGSAGVALVKLRLGRHEAGYLPPDWPALVVHNPHRAGGRKKRKRRA